MLQLMAVVTANAALLYNKEWDTLDESGRKLLLDSIIFPARLPVQQKEAQLAAALKRLCQENKR